MVQEQRDYPASPRRGVFRRTVKKTVDEIYLNGIIIVSSVR